MTDKTLHTILLQEIFIKHETQTKTKAHILFLFPVLPRISASGLFPHQTAILIKEFLLVAWLWLSNPPKEKKRKYFVLNM